MGIVVYFKSFIPTDAEFYQLPTILLTDDEWCLWDNAIYT